jgi:hypothetical protein
MTHDELIRIPLDGLKRLGMSIDQSAADAVATPRQKRTGWGSSRQVT